MTVKVIRADGETELFETKNYIIGNKRGLHPLIISVYVYSNGRLIKKYRRPGAFFYKHFKFKSFKVQEELKNLVKEAREKETVEKQ